MVAKRGCRNYSLLARRCGLPVLFGLLMLVWAINRPGAASGGDPTGRCFFSGRICRQYVTSSCDVCDGPAGTWYWLRSPDEEKRAVAALYNRYCIRCHGVDGRGVWDIPDVPNFTNPRWQTCRSNDQLSRIILEGRGAVMPPFRGTMSLEEACAMARYLRTFVPAAEVSRPNLEKPAIPPAKK